MKFDLSQYETVEERIRRFYETNEDARIVTHNLTTPEDRTVSTWIVRAEVFLTSGDQANGLPKASGLAFEIDGGPGANSTAALENAETSAIGRALANAGYSGRKRPSREEMSKANRDPEIDWLAAADKIMNVKDLRDLYAKAKAANAPVEILGRLKDYGTALNSQSKDSGTRRSGNNSGS